MKRILEIGNGLINNVSKVLNENGIIGNYLYLTDSNIDKLYGKIVIKELRQLGQYEKVIVVNNSISFTMHVVEKIISSDFDAIVALGGGRVLDTAKYAAYICKKPLLSIPTTAANDGIASPISVLKESNNKPKSLGCAVPDMLIVDTEIISNCPRQLIRAGIGDTLSNYMALKDWKLACEKKMDQMNGYAFLMSQNSLDILFKSQFKSINSEFISVLVKSLVMSGIAMDYAGSSRPVSGSEHLISHALDFYGNTDNLHGVQVALCTLTMLKLLDEDYSDILRYLEKYNIDINPKSLGIDKELFLHSIQNASTMRKNRYTYLNEINLDTKHILKIYDELLEEL